VGNELSKLIDYSNCGQEVSVVYWMHYGTHDSESFSLWNAIFLDWSLYLSLLVWLLISELLEVSGHHELMILLTTLMKNVILCILLEFILDLIKNAVEETLLSTIAILVL
jgi:hypothetical protein